VADSHSIHVVRTPQVPAKPQPLDPADVAAAVLDTVRECGRALKDLQEYQDWALGQMRGEINQLEVAALRALTQALRKKGGRISRIFEGMSARSPTIWGL
jgi:hypothetical protein